MARTVLSLLISLFPVALGGAAFLALQRFLHLDQATAVAIAVGVVLGLHIVLSAGRELNNQREFRQRMRDLDIMAGNWGGALSAISARLTTLEEKLPADQAGEIRRISFELDRVSALAGRLSATVTGMEGRVTEPLSPKVHVLRPRPPNADPTAPPAPPPEPAPELKPDQIAEAARRAVADRRTEIFLQPIVTLPQRRPRYYEVMVRLRGPGDTLIMPTDFIPAAARAGLLPRIDNLVLFQAVRVLRRISAKGDVGLFCNISPQSLADGDAFGEFVGFAEANRGLADRLVFEMSQEAVNGLGAAELEALGLLAGMGYRFSMDGVTDPGRNLQWLADHSFQFVKMNAQAVIEHSRRSHAPGDLVEMIARFGIDLVADRIETEQMVIDLLDCDVRLGQGYLFAPPRPVRAEVLNAGGGGAEAAAV